jgi:hypothetical protein
VPLPLDDEWVYAGLLAGDPLSWQFLLSFHNEHRIPLPRLVYLVGVWLTGDLRAPMFVAAAALALSAAVLVRAAGRLRGRVWWTDAAVPLVLLNASHADNLTWGFQTSFAVGTLLACGVLSVIASAPGGPTGRRLAMIGLALVLLPACGPNGLAFVPALAAWFVWLGWRRATDAGSVRGGLACWAWAAAGLAAVGAYFVGYERPAHHPTPATVADVGRTAVQLVALGAGTAVDADAGPLPKPWLAVGVAVLAGTAVAAGGLLVRGRAGDRRAVGLASFAAAALCLTAGIAAGRAGQGADAGLTARYAMLGTPLLAWLYVVWPTAVSPAGARFAQVLICGLCGLLFWSNTVAGTAAAARRHGPLVSAVAEIRHGIPAQFAVDRVLAVAAHPPWIPRTRGDIDRLRAAGVGVFGRIAPEAVYAEREVPVTLDARGGALADGLFRADVYDAELVLPLPDKAHIRGVRWEYELASPTGYRPEMSLDWAGGRTIWHPLHCTGGRVTSHVWIDDTTDRLRLRFFTPGTTFRPVRITLLTDPR